jgi:hypothetical protein
VSEQEAYRKFLASNPEGKREYHTISISHSQMSKTYNLVMDSVELIANDENGLLITYSPAAMLESGSMQTNDLDQSASYTISDEFNVLDGELDRIDIDSVEPVVVTFRGYHSDYLSKPVEVLTYNANSVAQAKGSFTIKTGVPDLNSDQTGEIYNLDDFPMMRSLF